MTPRPVPASAADREITIARDVRIPLLGFGVWQLVEGAEGERAIVSALEAGYATSTRRRATGTRRPSARPCARAASRARRSSSPRSSIRAARIRRPRRSAASSCSASGPSTSTSCTIRGAIRAGHGPGWSARSSAASRARSASATSPRRIWTSCSRSQTSRPAVNQIQLNPFAYRRALVEARAERGIAVEAYSPLTRGRDIDDATVARVAERLGRTPAQVMLALGHRARLHRAAEVEPARAADRERRDLRLRARRRGSRRARRTRSHGRHRACRRAAPGGSALAGSNSSSSVPKAPRPASKSCSGRAP